MSENINNCSRLKINFVSHLNPFYYYGGGEQVTRRLIETGRKRGHKIKVVAMKPKKYGLLSRITMHRRPDLWVLFDVFNCPEHKKHFTQSFITSIILSGRYVIGQNAYADTCYLNALPCNGIFGDGDNCVVNKSDYYDYYGNNHGWKDGYCPINDNRELFENAMLNIFVSPLHASVFQKIYPAITSTTYIQRPLIDVDMFEDKKMKRDIKYASYGGMSEAKGFYNIRQRFPDEEIVFFGSNNGDLAEKYEYGKIIGRIPYDKMPAFLNRVEYYLHMPRWPEPQGLIVNQAALCGCKLITNENVGALTQDSDMMDRIAYKDNASELWEKLEEIVKS